tara:strand:+ start:312 stop:584 length:273 start_codon:yes stop_codon:yes gene_type:complete
MDNVIAETIAVQALAYVVSDEEALVSFITQTGVSIVDLQSSVRNPEFLASVLDFLFEQDERLVAFCERISISPEQAQRARLALPGATFPM